MFACGFWAYAPLVEDSEEYQAMKTNNWKKMQVAAGPGALCGHKKLLVLSVVKRLANMQQQEYGKQQQVYTTQL
jgi:hypothetical protein